jgi:outer membrane protein TolC
VNAFLSVLAAEHTVQAARADVERRETFDKAVRVLVDSQLRAGADASRADAELARAKVNLARAEQQEQVSRAVLANILGMPDTTVEVRGGSLLGPPPNMSSQTAAITDHPIAEAEHARVDEALSQVRISERAYYPKVYFQSAVFGRGSGVDPAGNFLGGTNGLAPDRSNWATGVMVTFSVFDIFTIRSRTAVEAANGRAEAARYDQTLQDLTSQFRKAQASLEGARHVAENTPLELDAARTTENQQRVRYQAGLATLVDVADAQSLLVQAETDDALARLAVWQNLASVAASQGDLQPFLQLVRAKAKGGP